MIVREAIGCLVLLTRPLSWRGRLLVASKAEALCSEAIDLMIQRALISAGKGENPNPPQTTPPRAIDLPGSRLIPHQGIKGPIEIFSCSLPLAKLSQAFRDPTTRFSQRRTRTSSDHWDSRLLPVSRVDQSFRLASAFLSRH